MLVTEVYKASSVESRCVCQILEAEGIECQLVGENLESTFGFTTFWNTASILVSEADAQRAREILAEHLTQPAENPRTRQVFQFGLRALLVNFTFVALVLGLYRPLSQFWPGFAVQAFYLLLIGNLLVLAYVRRKRRAIRE
jgi:hypothetical protein